MAESKVDHHQLKKSSALEILNQTTAAKSKDLDKKGGTDDLVVSKNLLKRVHHRLFFPGKEIQERCLKMVSVKFPQGVMW